MAGRKHLPPPDALIHLTRGGASRTRPNPYIDESRLGHRLHHSPPSSAAAARVIPVAVLEDRLAGQNREIQSLLGDNQRLAATHVALKQDLTATQQELRQLSAAAANVKAERDAEIREIYEKSLKMDAEVRAIDALNSELIQVRADIQELDAGRNELTLQLKAIESDLVRVRAQSDQVTAIKAEIEAMRREIQRGRNAIDFEKKTHASNLAHRQAMDKNMIIMVREVEKLRAELANAEKRATAAVTAAAAIANSSTVYPASYDNPQMGYGGVTYPDSYSMHQIQARVDGLPQYASGATPHHPYDLQHTHVHK